MVMPQRKNPTETGDSVETLLEPEREKIISALVESRNPYERWEHGGTIYSGIRVVRGKAGDKAEIERILGLGNNIRKMDYWKRLVEADDCEIIKLSPGQYSNRYKIIDTVNGVGMLLVEPRYGELTPIWIMPLD